MSEIEQEYLTFLLNGEEFGVDILCVQEIRVWSGVTELPNKPDYIKGVINLRGVIIPIIDLRQRFGQQQLEYNEQTVTIILRSRLQNKSIVVMDSPEMNNPEIFFKENNFYNKIIFLTNQKKKYS